MTHRFDILPKEQRLYILREKAAAYLVQLYAISIDCKIADRLNDLDGKGRSQAALEKCNDAINVLEELINEIQTQ